MNATDTADRRDSLRSKVFLERLLPATKVRILATARRARYPPGQAIFSADAPVAGIIETGLVRIVEELPGGRSFTHRHVSAGGVIGLSALVGARNRVSAFAVGAVQLLWLAPTTIRELQDTPTFTLAVAKELLARLEDTSAEAMLRLRGNLPRRLALELLDLASELGEGDPVALRITHEAIADHVGTSREVVTRILRDLAAARLVIQEGRGRLILADPDALLAYGRFPGNA